MTDEVIEAALTRSCNRSRCALCAGGLAWALRAAARRRYGHERHGHVRLSDDPDRRGSDDACERALLTIITAHIAKTNTNCIPMRPT